MDAEKALMGLQLCGRFGGVDEKPGGSAVLVDVDYRDGEGKLQTVTRRADFTPFSGQTGERSAVSQQLDDFRPDDLVAVAVWVNTRGRTTSYRALEVLRQGAASAVSAPYLEEVG